MVCPGSVTGLSVSSRWPLPVPQLSICMSVTAMSASSFLWSDGLNQHPGHLRWHLLPASAFPAIFLTDVFARVLASRAETSPFFPCCISSSEDRSTNNFFLACVTAINQSHLWFFWRKWPSGYNIQTHPSSTLETGSWYVDQVSHKFVVTPLSLSPTSLCHHSGLELNFCQRCFVTAFPRTGGTVSLLWLLGAL